ncbi:hypothetical protein chiPu_0032900 [Chiloscyllium punctatum]|uniref:Uncharacterized protein n=1 Tax=Chiloscyllium punctatum TaxID=137246 RepID=A0A401U142_CHIPU|nr:hypothetical protein [Chiloscyllium punctatum]
MRLVPNKMAAMAQVPGIKLRAETTGPAHSYSVRGTFTEYYKTDRTTTGSIIPPGPPPPRHYLDTETGAFIQIAHAPKCSIQRMRIGVFSGTGDVVRGGGRYRAPSSGMS